jgi:SAM-dependent methyltransferase
MSNSNLFQSAGYLKENQYRTSSNLDARAALHRQFSTAKVSWQSWVFRFLALEPHMRVLECGCGPGWLWREKIDHIPSGCHITLTDLSPGMVAEAESMLAKSGHHFEFGLADIQSLGFEDETFDVAVANHMLYHVPDLAQGLSELRRVLKPTGRLIAATNGADHMKELAELVLEPLGQASVFPRLRGEAPQLLFRLENGNSLLAPYFETVERHLYRDSLLITEEAPLLAYVLSMIRPGTDVPDTAVAQLQAAWRKMIDATGAINISKHSGLFVATKAP